MRFKTRSLPARPVTPRQLPDRYTPIKETSSPKASVSIWGIGAALFHAGFTLPCPGFSPGTMRRPIVLTFSLARPDLDFEGWRFVLVGLRHLPNDPFGDRPFFGTQIDIHQRRPAPRVLDLDPFRWLT